MLKFIRRNATAWWIKAMFFAIAAVFVLWGVGSVGEGGGNVVARVNGENIDPLEFERTYRNMQRFYASIYKDQLTPEVLQALNLRARTVDQLITVSLLRQEAERLGLMATDAEVRNAISSTAAFQVDGVFDKDLYLRTLRAQEVPLTAAEYEESQREDIVVSKLRDLVTAGVQVNEADVRDRFEYENEKVALHYVKLEPSQFTDKVELKEEDVKAYYEAHSEELRVPDRVEIEYVLFPNARFESGVEVSEADAKQYYDENQGEFAQQEQVHARHILIRSPEAADEQTKAEARQRAEAALTRIKEGADFATLATEVSEDSSASNGGDLGFFRRGMMVPPFEEAAFSLQPGQTSNIVETQFGFHIIKVEERTEAGAPPFEETRAQIEAKLRTQRAQDLVRERANQGHVDASGGKALGEIAAAHELEVKTAGPLAKTDQVGGISGTALSNAAVSVEAVGVGPIVTVPDGAVLFRVVQKLPSHVPELAAIREQVEEAVRKDKASQLAKTTADEMLAAAQEKGLRPVAEERAFQLQESGPFGRTDVQIGSIGAAPELKKQAFQLTVEKPIAPAAYDVDGAYVIAALHERFPADSTVFDQQKEQMIETAEARYKNEVLTKLVTRLRADASISVGRGYETGETAAL